MSEPIRILHVIGIMNRGGAENMIMNLYRSIDRTRVQFDFVENEGGEAAFDREILSLGGRIYRCPHYNGKNHFAYRKWWNSFFHTHQAEYAAVHGHVGSTAAIYLSIAARYGIYTIAHSHSINQMRSVGDALYALFSYPTRFVADTFFACSRDAGISRYGKQIGHDPKRCTVLHNAIDTTRFAFSPDARKATRKKLGLSETQIVLGNISRFSDPKNHTFLLDIFAAVHKKEPGSVLLLEATANCAPGSNRKSQSWASGTR